MKKSLYRIWDLKEKKMTSDLAFGIHFAHTLNKIFESDRYIFLQYTGIDDDNGKKIFDGDIVKTKLVSKKHLRDKRKTVAFYKVKWKEKYGRWSFPYTISVAGLRNRAKHWVIGNIYQNKTILKDKRMAQTSK